MLPAARPPPLANPQVSYLCPVLEPHRLSGLAGRLGRANLPVIVHPEFWTRRRLAIPGREPLETPTTSRRALEEVGFDVIEQRQPSFLLDGALLVTGEVDRTTDFEQGFAIHQAYRDQTWVPDPLILDDQALIANVPGKVSSSSPAAATPASSTSASTRSGSPARHACMRSSAGFTSTGRYSNRSSRPHSTHSSNSNPTSSSRRTAPDGAPSMPSPHGSRGSSFRAASEQPSTSPPR
jgi:hypothetical protein